jgi:hypothetical protein
LKIENGNSKLANLESPDLRFDLHGDAAPVRLGVHGFGGFDHSGIRIIAARDMTSLRKRQQADAA